MLQLFVQFLILDLYCYLLNKRSPNIYLLFIYIFMGCSKLAIINGVVNEKSSRSLDLNYN